MAGNLSRRMFLATSGLTTAAFGAYLVSADSHSEDYCPTGFEKVLEWEGQGSEHAVADCKENETAVWDWRLTPGGPDPIEDATLHVLIDGDVVEAEGYRPGEGQERGAMHFDIEKNGGGEVQDACVGYNVDEEAGPPGRGPGDEGRSILTISGVSCEKRDLPKVRTLPAFDINGESAILAGRLRGLGNFDDVAVFFEWREHGESDWSVTDAEKLGETGNFEYEITGLSPGTTYEFRAVAEAPWDDRSLSVEGAIETFLKPEHPTVETEPAEEINGYTARLVGKLTSLGSFDEVEVFFEWRKIGAESWTETDRDDEDETSRFTFEIEGLEQGESYEFRAISEVEKVELAELVRVEGDTRTFEKPDADEPSVMTVEATDINGSTATLVGKLTAMGDYDEVDVFFEWREEGTDDWMETPAHSRTETGEYDDEISGLDPGSSYEFRAVGAASDGERESRVEGEILSFEKDPIEEKVYWQLDFGEGAEPPLPPRYWPDDGFFALGNSENGVTENPSHARTRTAGQLGDVEIADWAFSFDDPDDPSEATITFEVEPDGEARDLHLAVFVLPGPFDEGEVDEQELHAYTSGEYAGGDSDSLSVSIPQP